ncbi:thioesterase-like superfamily-domain-containing protein [Mycena sp. CBHHK59/15]|nr:thioesterase-like superfamily-domain-containing protein [Mycena sp. CBHHK59/15]
MAPFKTALVVRLANSESSIGSASHCYSGDVDADWTVLHVPNGGYMLGFIVQSCLQSQASSEHPDPLHVSAHFLQAASISTFDIKLRILKQGRSFTNIIADLVQANHTCITAHFIFGKIPPSRPIIALSSGYTRRHPLALHPSKGVVSDMPKAYTFSKHVRWAEDLSLLQQDTARNGGGVSLWGAWVELADSEERITPASLAFLTDCFKSMPVLFPTSVTGVPESFWLPTLTLSVEFKAPIPPPSAVHSARTVGVYVISGYSSDPQHRHDTFVEIWTAPSDIGEGAEVESWRDAQVCLALGTQMQLVVSASVNERVGNKQASAKL